MREKFEHHRGHHHHQDQPVSSDSRSRRRHGPHPMGPRDGLGRIGGPRGRARRSKRGDVRAAVLLLLDELPRNGYQLIQELEQRSNGNWRPSPGSIYPVLSQLEDEGLVVVSEHDSGRTFSLTDTGRTHLTERRDAFGRPWEEAAGDPSGPRFEMWSLVRPLISALRQVIEVGSDEQVKRALDIVKDTRRKVYLILAEDESAH